MSTPIDHGGPAFPRPSSISETYYAAPALDSMSLRDWFAGHAIAGIMAAQAGERALPLPEVLAVAAFATADAMIAARAAKPGEKEDGK